MESFNEILSEDSTWDTDKLGVAILSNPVYVFIIVIDSNCLRLFRELIEIDAQITIQIMCDYLSEILIHDILILEQVKLRISSWKVFLGQETKISKRQSKDYEQWLLQDDSEKYIA